MVRFFVGSITFYIVTAMLILPLVLLTIITIHAIINAGLMLSSSKALCRSSSESCFIYKLDTILKILTVRKPAYCRQTNKGRNLISPLEQHVGFTRLLTSELSQSLQSGSTQGL